MNVFWPTDIDPRDVIYDSTHRSATDTAVALYIKYKGSQVYGGISLANGTGDISFKHGASSPGSLDTSVNPNGSTPGVIDLSGEAATFAALEKLVNASDNWELWYEAALPTDATEASGTAKILNNLADQNCKLENGYAVLIDTSTALYHSIGVTQQGPSSKIHGNDPGWLHYITKIAATSTYASGTSVINIYSVNDYTGVVTLLDSHAGGATTVEKVLGDGSYPLYNADGNRLVVKLVNSAAMGPVDMTVFFASAKVGIGVQKSKLFGPLSV